MKTVGAKARVVGDNSSDAVQVVPLDLVDALCLGNVRHQEYQRMGTYFYMYNMRVMNRM